MSTPAPATVQVVPATLPAPCRAGLPMSAWLQPAGRPGADGVTATWSKTAVLRTPASWDVTNSPIWTAAGSPDSDTDPTSAQVVPTADSYPNNEEPDRVSFSQRGAPDALPPMSLWNPACTRVPCAGVVVTNAYGEPAVRPAFTIRP